MFPGQQGATCPAQLWPPRLGIKLLEGAPSMEKCTQGVYFRMASQKIGALSLVFAQSVENAKVVSYQPCHPCIFAITSPPSGVHIFAWPANFRNLSLRPNLAYFRIYYPRTRRIKHLMHHATRGRMPDRPYEELPSPGERASPSAHWIRLVSRLLHTSTSQGGATGGRHDRAARACRHLTTSQGRGLIKG